jgi:hypothetical protein
LLVSTELGELREARVSVGAVVTLMVLVESIVLFVAVRWLMTGLRSAECREWPPIRPLAAASNLATTRDAASRTEESAVAVG